MKTKKTITIFEMLMMAMILFIIACLVVCWVNMTPNFGGTYANNVKTASFTTSELQI
jgi:hypothetical protein